MNPGLPTFDAPIDMLEQMLQLTSYYSTVRNFVGVIRDMSEKAICVETKLFPKGPSPHNLDFFSAACFSRATLQSLALPHVSALPLSAGIFSFLPARQMRWSFTPSTTSRS